jgi:lipopolysaccharide/colanic/teichoic acid biosynthesis glycosyltransferase
MMFEDTQRRRSVPEMLVGPSISLPHGGMSSTIGGLARWIDIAAALTALITLAPLLLAVAAIVALTSPGPVLFRHRRVGRHGRPFDMLKFRTMHHGGVGPQITAKTDPRITRVGGVLRKTKLDELPELWNVVCGDMSLVGPRPESPQYVDLSHQLWQQVLLVRPGVTDPMTLHLRNEEELLAGAHGDLDSFYRDVLVPYKLRGYVAYLATRTWKSDLAVLFRTAIGIIVPRSAPPPALEDLRVRDND